MKENNNLYERKMMMARQIVPLDGEWLFQADMANEGNEQEWYKHGLTDGQQVRIPHTWNIQEGLEDYRGTGWYSYSFTVPEDWQDKLVRVQFDAVYRDTIIWLNGQKVLEHNGSGYTPFLIDITPFLNNAATQLLVVSVNNENSATALPMNNTFDWADDGGIYRGVSFIVTGQYAIDYAKLSAAPLFEKNERNANSGVLSGTVHLWNNPLLDGDSTTNFRLNVTVEKDGQVVKEQVVEQAVTAKEGIITLSELTVDKLDLWHFDHPHLYSVRLTLFVGEVEQAVDELVVNVGFREIKAVGNQLLLNREPVRLMGVEWMPGSHPERGMAETEEQLFEMLTHIKHANCVITRFHWQQDSKLLDWCDRNGLLVQEEIPHWAQPFDPGDETLALATKHAEAMIARHYNHPSIFAWGMGNEVNAQSPITVRYFERLKLVIEQLDHTRSINYVSNSVHENPAADASGVGDMIMWNDYIGTWHGDLDRTAEIKQIVAAYPDKPLVISEFGLCEPKFTGGDERREQILIENTLEYRKHKSIAVLYYFSLNDYRTQMGEEGVGRFCQRVHGSMDMYGNAKPSYYALRTLGSPVELTAVYNAVTEGLELTVTVRNDIPNYAIDGYRISLENEQGDNAEVILPALSPGQSYMITNPAISVERWEEISFQIVRPTGFSVIDGRLGDYKQ
ncbi:glycoside hydrolase family 2 protein [Paenibacillus yanchengensis]